MNNIRAVYRPDGRPRQILTRAALNAATLDEAMRLLTTSPCAGAFHHTLGQMGNNRLFSVEATGSGYSVTQLSGVYAHPNHLVHPQLSAIEQVSTANSGSRQRPLDEWLKRDTELDGTSAKAILSDQHDAVLPIYRLSPQDPDEENTLVKAIFTLKSQQVEWQVFTHDRAQAVLQGAVSQ